MPPPSRLNRTWPILRYLKPQVASRCAAYAVAATAPAQSKLQPVEIPPESPKYIYIPQPPQRQAKYFRPQKGVLPKPRKIFESKRVDKAAPGYLAAVAPEPTTERSTDHLSAEQKELLDYKARQSALRRENLKAGLLSLRRRKTQIDTGIAARSARRQSAYQRRIAAPEREDERLTRPSVLDALKPGKLHVLPDPRLPAIQEQKKRKHAKKMAAKMEHRRYALHTLYMNAKDFIVTEADLEKKVVEEFDKEFYKRNPRRGIWDEEGIPEGTKEMISEEMRGLSVVDRNTAHMEASKERVKKISEELTGGKM